MHSLRVLSLVFAAILLSAVSVPAAAQTEADLIEAIRAQVGANRQALVAENLALTESESEAFWPVYREFHQKRNTLLDRRIALLREFRDNFDSLSDEQARDILNEYLSIQEDMLKLRKKYVKDFRRVLSDKKTLRYFQIENKLDTIIEYDLSQVVPLAE